MAVTPPRSTRCDEPRKNGHPPFPGVMTIWPIVPVGGPSTRPTALVLPSSLLVVASRPLAVARHAATDVIRHDAGNPVSWNGNFTTGFAVAANLTCAATLRVVAGPTGVPHRETYSIAQACRAYSQASAWPANQKPGRPPMAGAGRDSVSDQLMPASCAQFSSGWTCLRRYARAWPASRLQVPRAQTVSVYCPLACEPTTSCSSARVEPGLFTLRGSPFGSQPKAAYGASGLNGWGTDRVSGAGGTWGSPPPPAMAPMPATSAATAAVASSGAPARAQRRLRASVRPRWRASPMSTRDGGGSVALSLSISARAPASSMSYLLRAPGDRAPGDRAPGSGGVPALFHADRARIGVRFERPAQAGQCLGGLALDGSGGAAKDPRGLVYVQVAVEPQDQGRPLARWQAGQRRADVQCIAHVRSHAGRVRQLAGQGDPSRPAAAPFAEERAHQDRAGVAVCAFHRAGPPPVHVQAGDGGLHQVVGLLPVLAEQVRDAAQPRQPGPDVAGESLVSARAHH